MWWNNLKAATLTPAKVAIGPNTSFKGRPWSDAIAVRNLVCMAWPIVFVLLSIIAFSGGVHHLISSVTLPAVLSVCLVVINVVPHLLLLLRWNFGPGSLLARACAALFFASWAAGIAALVFLFVLFPRPVRRARCLAARHCAARL